MSIPIRSIDEFLAARREHLEWREAIRRKILTEELLGLPAKLEKAELERREDSREIQESIQGLTETTRALAQQQERTEATLQSFMESTQAFQRSMEEFQRSMETFQRSMEEFKEARRKDWTPWRPRSSPFWTPRKGGLSRSRSCWLARASNWTDWTGR
ncbi:hypothetical protein [Verrucomicrobium sp. 3C]|uniref:hypothetical protein n=1 Tax=Verrucomicrobium sp. 3C TaxID=1134055 RepID=UPI000380BBD4|nr:hypothetical protein [Verrucomicrobium sp. 3C]